MSVDDVIMMFSFKLTIALVVPSAMLIFSINYFQGGFTNLSVLFGGFLGAGILVAIIGMTPLRQFLLMGEKTK